MNSRIDTPHQPPANSSLAVRLAYSHHTIACQVAVFLWVLAAALLYQSSTSGALLYELVGFAVMVAAAVLAFVAQRRLRAELAAAVDSDRVPKANHRDAAPTGTERGRADVPAVRAVESPRRRPGRPPRIHPRSGQQERPALRLEQ